MTVGSRSIIIARGVYLLFGDSEKKVSFESASWSEEIEVSSRPSGFILCSNVNKSQQELANCAPA